MRGDHVPKGLATGVINCGFKLVLVEDEGMVARFILYNTKRYSLHRADTSYD